MLDYARFPEAAVHHPDTRVPADPSEPPYRSIGQLLIYYADGTVAQSTAFLVGPSHILTSADGLVGPAGLPEFEHAVFTPALQGDRKPFGSATLVNVAIPKAFVEACDQLAYDMAIARLDHPIGEQAGHLVVDFAAAAHEVTGEAVSTAGYAVDTGITAMIRAEGRIERHGYPGVWWHDLDAAPGQQGSPLWIDRDGEPVVVGVYVRGFGRHSYAVGPAFKEKGIVKVLGASVREYPGVANAEAPRPDPVSADAIGNTPPSIAQK